MKIRFYKLVCSLILIGCPAGSLLAQPQFVGSASAPAEPLSLWYRQPAALNQWTSALPIGNGRIGAMVFGGVDKERLQLNEDTLWAGGPYDPVNPKAKEALPKVRELVFAGQYQDAARLVTSDVLSKPIGQAPYETAGDLNLTFPGMENTTVQDYRRKTIRHVQEILLRIFFDFQLFSFDNPVWLCAIEDVVKRRCSACIYRPGQPGRQRI